MKTDEQKPEYQTETRAATFIRVAKNPDNPFVMIDRRPIENPKMSWKAKGLLAYLLSRPDDWVVRFRDLVNRSPDGAHTVRAAMKELKEAGHVQVVAEREGGRVKRWIYTIKELPDVEFQQVEKQQVENRTYTNKNKDLSKKKVKKAATPPTPTPQEIKLYHSVVKRYPNREVYSEVVSAIQKVSDRLLRTCSAEDLQPYFDKWLTKSSNRANFSVWLLEWAVSGNIPNQKPFGRFAQKVANVVSTTQEQFEAAMREAQKLVEA